MNAGLFNLKYQRHKVTAMITISSVTPSTYSGYTAPVSNKSVVSTPAPQAVASAQFTPSTPPASPLTYNTAGLLNSFAQASSGTKTTVQAAQNAYLSAQTAVSQALDSLMSGSSSSTSGTDIFGASTTANDPTGLSSLVANTGAPATTAQNAYLAAQNAVTQAQNSISIKAG